MSIKVPTNRSDAAAYGTDKQARGMEYADAVRETRMRGTWEHKLGKAKLFDPT